MAAIPIIEWGAEKLIEYVISTYGAEALAAVVAATGLSQYEAARKMMRDHANDTGPPVAREDRRNHPKITDPGLFPGESKRGEEFDRDWFERKEREADEASRRLGEISRRIDEVIGRRLPGNEMPGTDYIPDPNPPDRFGLRRRRARLPGGRGPELPPGQPDWGAPEVVKPIPGTEDRPPLDPRIDPRDGGPKDTDPDPGEGYPTPDEGGRTGGREGGDDAPPRIPPIPIWREVPYEPRTGKPPPPPVDVRPVPGSSRFAPSFSGAGSSSGRSGSKRSSGAAEIPLPSLYPSEAQLIAARNQTRAFRHAHLARDNYLWE